MVPLIKNILKGIAMWIIKQIIMMIRFASPYALRLVIASIVYAIQTCLVSIIGLFRGIVVVDEIAQHWLEVALQNRFPTLWERELYAAFYVLAVWTILLGWSIMVFMSVFTLLIAVNLIF